jgi:hypothetical protein
MSTNQSEGSVELRIIRGSLNSLSLFEITDYELEIFEQGSPSSTYFNFAIFFFSVGASFLATLLTVKIDSVYIFSIFVIITVIGICASMVLFQLWRKTKSTTKELCKKIRARAPTPTVIDAVPPARPDNGATESSA